MSNMPPSRRAHTERTPAMRLPSSLLRTRGSREGARGQILIVAVLALVAIVGMVGLVIDGGALFAQQRIAQNGADSAATSGTVVIAQYMGGAKGRTNQDVYDAVAASALATTSPVGPPSTPTTSERRSGSTSSRAPGRSRPEPRGSAPPASGPSPRPSAASSARPNSGIGRSEGRGRPVERRMRRRR